MSSSNAAPTPVEVVKFEPQSVENIKSDVAESYVQSTLQTAKMQFEIDPKVSDYMGLTDLKKKDEKKAFDTEVMKYVQKIKDSAFQEAYEKGLNEGQEKAKLEALEGAKVILMENISTLVDVVNKMVTLQARSYEEFEADLVAFSYFLAEKIIQKEIDKDPEIIKTAIKKISAARSSQKDKFSLKISRKDFDFIKNDLKSLGPEVDLSKINLEPDDSLNAGDVIMDGENGRIDGRLSSRLEQLKKILDQAE